MENTIVISDRLFLVASAFFRVDNTDWLNNHELIYEDNEDDIINRFNSKLYNIHQIALDYLLFIMGIISKYLCKWIPYMRLIKPEKTEPDTQPNQYSDNDTVGFKKYDGFYSGRNGDSPQQRKTDSDGFWNKIKEFFQMYFAKDDAEIQRDSYRTGRMYRGNSLD